MPNLTGFIHLRKGGEFTMQRRQLIGVAAALAVTAGHALAQAGAKPATGGHHRHHGGNAKAELLVDALSECINKGETCLAHCLVLLGEGERTVAACARSVSETIALCDSLRKLAAQGSPRATAVARIARAACLDCEKECRKHENRHAECRDCAKACAACARECEAFAA